MCCYQKSIMLRTLTAPWLLFMATSLIAAPDGSNGLAARLATHDKVDGEAYFALVLTLRPKPSADEARDIVAVFDTSASQVGVHRADALDAVRAMFDGLHEEDRVKLVAADLRAVPLSDGFVAPRGAGIQEALRKLERRVPLGSTNMRVVLEQAARQFDNGTGNPKALIYIGEGMSKANFLDTRDFLELNETRRKLRVDTLYQVERSAVPFPDDPPITYSDPQGWEGLTLRGKGFATIDLAKRGGAEEKILNAMEDTTTLEFIETPRQDVVDYLKGMHGIERQVDNRALEDVGIGSDTPITRNLNGITLRSALRLMLKDLDLTYVIRDEVLLITTAEEAES
jgi:hypothetical protein